MPPRPKDRGRATIRTAASILLALGGCGTSRDVEPDASVPIASELGRIDALIAERRYRAALEAVDAGLVSRPEDRELLDLRVKLLRLLGLERQALAQVLALRKLAPEDARLAYEAGELAARTGDTGLAREQFAAARALAPDDWRPAVAEAALRLNEKPPAADAADALLAPWLDGDRARVEARFHHALAVESRGDAAAALAAYERTLELDKYHLASLCNSARLAEAAGDSARALEFLRRARAEVAADDEALLHEIDRRIVRLTPPHAR